MLAAPFFLSRQYFRQLQFLKSWYPSLFHFYITQRAKHLRTEYHRKSDYLVNLEASFQEFFEWVVGVEI